MRFILVSTLSALLVATSALAQTPTGTILGGVKDAQGAAIPGATVTATQGEKKASATTNADGIYQLADLADG